jgi:hypothetical protein
VVYNRPMHLHREHRSATATRVARAYQRRRGGLRCFQIEVDEVAAVDMLVAAKLLDPRQVDDHCAICVALERLVELFAKEKS